MDLLLLRSVCSITVAARALRCLKNSRWSGREWGFESAVAASFWEVGIVIKVYLFGHGG